ncbi:actin-related protein 9 isoform X4 [Nymphaea colorata]|uniref:actin-related protein 9 isoform X4 n=1 Tax=Nymphaea colorata TaxID=210225 RepID=UPI00129DA7A7|nr:actin-related protein 9 isoform X4 [Nymphaea colorata]
MDYLKTVVPSQLLAERGSNLVVINPGSANVRIGLAHQNAPFSIPHCIARHIRSSDSEGSQGPQLTIKDQMLVCPATPSQCAEREKAYDAVASLLKIPFLDEENANSSSHRKFMQVNHIDGYHPQNSKTDTPFSWTNVTEKNPSFTLPVEDSENKDAKENVSDERDLVESGKRMSEYSYREFICGEEALKIAPTDPYCLCRPIRRGHFNVSQYYSSQQVAEDLFTIWDWVLNEKLQICSASRSLYSAILVVPETFDSREIKEMLTIVLRDLKFGSAVIHQEGLAAAFGNGLSTACIDGVALPTSCVTLPFGGEDISRCLFWIQRHHQTWPAINTDPLSKPADMLMLERLKESYCRIVEGELDSVALVHSFETGKPAEAHKLRLFAVNVPPMGLFCPSLLVPDEHPPPPRPWFHDYEDMLEDTLHSEFPRRSDLPDAFLLGGNGLNMWDSYPVATSRLKREDNLGLAEAITSSIMSTGRIDLQRKLFCSLQLIGGVALTEGIIGAVEERVLHAIPSHEAIDTVEVLPSKTHPPFVPWKGGAILGVLDFGRDAWIQRQDWIQNGIYLGSGRKYKDSFLLQAQTMWYMNC